MRQINPFLHISLHLAIIEQVQTNRPFGINEAYYKLVNKYNNDELSIKFIIL